MWAQLAMPDRAHRLDELVRHARAMCADFEAPALRAACEAAVDATPECSLRDYYTFRVHEERAAVLAASLAAKHSSSARP